MKNKILKIVGVLLLLVIILTIVRFLTNRNNSLVSPGLRQTMGQVVSQSSPQPSVNSYNPPKEIQYDSTTDLKQELESVNPEVLDSDFSE